MAQERDIDLIADEQLPTVDESVEYEATFDFEPRQTIEAIFEINPNIADLNYVHDQQMASDHWVINHRLGKYPSVTVIDSANNTVCADVTYIDQNNLQIDFIGEFAGKAYLN